MQRNTSLPMVFYKLNLHGTIVLGCAALLSGCTSEVKFHDTGPWINIDCPMTECNKTYTINMAELLSCYGYSAELGGWGITAPPEIHQQCNPDYQVCTITVLSGFATAMVDGGCCLPYYDGLEDQETPGSCKNLDDEVIQSCTLPVSLSSSNTWDTAGDSLLDALWSDCGISPESDPPTCDHPVPIWGEQIPGRCNIPSLPDSALGTLN